MAATRSCPACTRPSGPKSARCMYCGAELPAVDGTEIASAEDAAEQQRARSERARELLAELKPEARALMPAEVLKKLEEDALGAAQAETDQPRSASRKPPPDVPPHDRPTGPRLVFSRPTPARRRHGTLRGADLLEEIAEDLLEELPMDSMADLPAAITPDPVDHAGGFEAAVIALLSRGGGPFGPRKSGWRLVLLPDAAYRSGLPWLRPRLAATARIDPYTATLHLQRPAPSFLMAAESQSELLPALQDLRRAGLHVALLQRGQWLRDRIPVVVRDIADLDSRELRLTTDAGEELQVARAELFGSYFAEVGPREESGGFATERNRWGLAKPTERGSLSDRFTPYFVLDLLRRDDPRPLRLRSSSFDFRRLGAGRGIAAAMNMREVARRLGEAPDGLPIDEGFRRVTSLAGADEPDDAGSGSAERALPRREADFTEYVLLRGVRHHPLG